MDAALCRPGRLDTLVYVPLPNETSRASILKAQLRNTPVAADVDLSFIASRTEGFSGADLGFITQRATKIAIKQAIAAEIESAKEREAGGDTAMEETEEDPVPELTRAHFEEAMLTARKSVSDVEIRRYRAFAESMKQNLGGGGSNNFRFPTEAEVGGASGGDGGFGQAAEDDDLYS